MKAQEVLINLSFVLQEGNIKHHLYADDVLLFLDDKDSK